MNHHNRFVSIAPRVVLLVVVSAWIAPVVGMAQEQRATPPQLDDNEFRTIFFKDLTSKVAADRPSVLELRGIKLQVASSAKTDASADASGGGGWTKLASAQSIEDEIKRQKLLLDGGLAQLGAFKGGGYADVRNELSIMATLFGVVTLYDGDIRWKDQAQTARNLLARTAGNCNSGEIQVHNECKTRQADLNDLMRGGPITSPPAADETNWSRIADRSILMEYLDVLALKELPDLTNTGDAIKSNPEKVKQYSDMVALVGEVLIQKGMDDADDPEYLKLCKTMRDSAVEIGAAVLKGDADTVRKSLGSVSQSCDACHEQYR